MVCVAGVDIRRTRGLVEEGERSEKSGIASYLYVAYPPACCGTGDAPNLARTILGSSGRFVRICICNAHRLVGGRHAALRHMGGPFGGGTRAPTLQGRRHECLPFGKRGAGAYSSEIAAGVPTLQRTGHERQPFGLPSENGARMPTLSA